MLREHGVEVDDAEPSRWRVAPGPIRAVDHADRARPVERRAVPGPGGDHRAARSPSATGRARPPRPATRSATCSAGWAATSSRDDARPHGHRARSRSTGVDVDLHDVGELTPVVAALCALADGPSYLRGIAHIRGHETDRLAALATELRGLGADVDRARRRPRAAPGDAARRAVPHLRRPPDGPRRGRPRLGGRGRRWSTTSRRRARRSRTSPRVWAGPAGRADDAAGTTSTTTSTTSARAATPAHAPRSDRRTTTPSTGWSPRSTAGRFTLLGRRRHGRGRSRHGRWAARASSSATGCGSSATSPASTAPWPGSSRCRTATTVLRRTADDDDPVERVVVANADQLVVVTALADPEPRPRLIDRALVAAYDAGMKPLLCLTKSDLADPETLLVDLPLARRAVGGDPARRRPDRAARAAARAHQRADRPQRRREVDPGQRAGARTPTARSGMVNAVTGRGRHTSTSALMLRPARSGGAAGSSTRPGSGRSGWPTCGPRT